MKRIFLLFILSVISIYADGNYELKLYEKLLPAIFTQHPINIYTDEKSKELLQESDKFNILKKCHEDVVLLISQNNDSIPNTYKNKPIFATSYKLYKNNPNSFGAFYWRKGRPQIIFKKTAIEQFQLTMPNSLQKYIK